MTAGRTPYRSVLFDFDGTLANSYPAIAASVNHVRGLHGLAPLSEEEVRRHVGRGGSYLLDHTVGRGDTAANLAAYKAHHPSVLHSGTTLLPGVAEALRCLHEHGLGLGVCSNKPVDFTRELLAYLQLDGYLAVVLGPEDVERPKPAPDMLRAAIQRLGASAEEVLYVGDMVVDIETARAAGVAVWAVPTGSEEKSALEKARPDRLLQGLAEIPSLLGIEC